MNCFAASFAALACLTTAAAAAAQTPPAVLGDRYVPAPWWMREPVVASIGNVRTEVPANRAAFTVGFQAVEKTVDAATARAGAQVQGLISSLAGYGAQKVQVETSFTMRPLYDQYRNREGTVVENQRSDQIERYQVDAIVIVRVRDLSLLERVYAAALNARPVSTSPVGFELQAGSDMNTWLAGEAMKDAARRARQAAEATGARIGAVKVIDPTGRACQTDVLAGWPVYAGVGAPTEVQASDFRAMGAPPPPPPPPPPPAPTEAPGGAQSLNIQVVLQPPLRTLEAQACVVYAISG